MPSSLEEKKELEGIRYLKENNDMSDPKIVLKVYNRIVDGCIFKTEVGISYLRELQSYLIDNNIDRSLIKPIPIISIDEVELVPVNNKSKVRFKPIERPKTEIKKVEKNVDVKAENPKVKAEEPKVSKASKETAKEPYKDRFIISIILNIFLLVVICVMMYIAASKDNPTILNYEEKLQNKYASWAEELESREDEINRRSIELERQFTE